MIGAGTLLYQATGNGAYLYQARQTAKAALAYFTPERLGAEIPFFAAVYFRNLLYLDSVTHDPPGPEDRAGLRQLRLAAPAPEQQPLRRRLARLAPSCWCSPRSCRSTRCCRPRRAPTSEPDGVAAAGGVLAGPRGVGFGTVTEATNLTTAEGLQALQAELAELEGDGPPGDRRAHQDRPRVGRSEGEQRVSRRQERAGAPRDEDRARCVRRSPTRSSSPRTPPAPAAWSASARPSSCATRTGVEQTWRIVSSRDAAPGEGRLSAESPVAVALLGSAPGEEISVSLPRGKRTLTVLSID